MIIVPVKEGENIEKALKKFKRKFEKTGVIKEMMLPEEIKWLNQYHRRVFEQLSPRLDDDEMEWLREACAPL